MGALRRIKRFGGLLAGGIRDVIDVVIPDFCIVCGRHLVAGERHLCLHCLATLPRTGIHHGGFTPLHERLVSTDVVIDRVAAWYYYSSGLPETAIVTAAKYDVRRSLARMAGREFAREISASGFFDGIDCLQPVPLSRFKQWKRGYNQSRLIALGVRDVTGISVVDCLKAHSHSTQTRKNAFDRWLNTRCVYSVRKKVLGMQHPQHILLIDDVLTTGATLVSCAESLHRAFPMAKISVLTIGATRRQ